MQPKWHLLYSFTFVYLLVYFFNFSLLGASLVFLSAIFIDLDHVLIYFIKTKNLNPKKFWSWSVKKGESIRKLSLSERANLKYSQFILHGIEFVLLLVIFSILNKLFIFILVGILFHLVLDLINLYYNDHPIYIKLSQIYLYKKNKSKTSSFWIFIITNKKSNKYY